MGQQGVVPATIRGVARLVDTGAPAEGAIISLQAPASSPASGEDVVQDQPRGLYATGLDTSGAFRFDNVPPLATI